MKIKNILIFAAGLAVSGHVYADTSKKATCYPKVTTAQAETCIKNWLSGRYKNGVNQQFLYQNPPNNFSLNRQKALFDYVVWLKDGKGNKALYEKFLTNNNPQTYYLTRYRNAVADFQYWIDELGKVPDAAVIRQRVDDIVKNRTKGTLNNCAGLPSAPEELAQGVPLPWMSPYKTIPEAEAVARALSTSALAKKLIRCVVDRNLGAIKHSLNFRTKNQTYAAFYADATKESAGSSGQLTTNAGTGTTASMNVKTSNTNGTIAFRSAWETSLGGFCKNSGHAYGVFQTAETAYDTRGQCAAWTQESDVPHIRWHPLTANTMQNFFDPYISAELGVRKMLHFINEGKRGKSVKTQTTPSDDERCGTQKCIMPGMPPILKYLVTVAGHNTGHTKSIFNNQGWADDYGLTVLWSYFYYLALSNNEMHSIGDANPQKSYAWTGKWNQTSADNPGLGSQQDDFENMTALYQKYFNAKIVIQSNTNNNSNNPEPTSGIGASGIGQGGNSNTLPPSKVDFEALKDEFYTEGDEPYRADKSLVFDALKSKFITSGGHGYRNELNQHRAHKERRIAASKVSKHFSANLKLENLSKNARAIVAQWHAEGDGAVVIVYVQDTDGTDDSNKVGVEGDGVFEVYSNIYAKDGKRVKNVLGQLKNGEIANISIDLEDMKAQVKVETTMMGKKESDIVEINSSKDEKIYFKFGIYLQGSDSGKNTTDPNKWEEYYKEKGITDAKLSYYSLKWQDL